MQISIRKLMGLTAVAAIIFAIAALVPDAPFVGVAALTLFAATISGFVCVVLGLSIPANQDPEQFRTRRGFIFWLWTLKFFVFLFLLSMIMIVIVYVSKP